MKMTVESRSCSTAEPHDTLREDGVGLSPRTHPSSTAASEHRHRAAAAAAPAATGSLCTPVSEAFQGTPEAPTPRPGGPTGEDPRPAWLQARGDRSPVDSTRAGPCDAPGGSAGTLPCRGLKGHSAPVSQLVKAMRLTVFPSADQLPGRWVGTRHGARSQLCRERRMWSCRLRAGPC